MLYREKGCGNEKEVLLAGQNPPAGSIEQTMKSRFHQMVGNLMNKWLSASQDKTDSTKQQQINVINFPTSSNKIRSAIPIVQHVDKQTQLCHYALFVQSQTSRALQRNVSIELLGKYSQNLRTSGNHPILFFFHFFFRRKI